MIKRTLIGCQLLIFFSGMLHAQSPEQMSAQQSKDVYQKPLDEVLSTIKEQYHVELQFEPKNTKGKVVTYAMWRFRTDIKETLDNVLKPLDLVWKETGENKFEIAKYEYFRKSFSEGKKHLEHLETFYASAEAFDQRKEMIRSCMLQTLGINPAIKKNSLNPIIRSKRIMDGYTVENVAFESFPGYYVCGSLYRPLSGGKHAAILSPHGHFYDKADPMIPDQRGRYRPV